MAANEKTTTKKKKVTTKKATNTGATKKKTTKKASKKGPRKTPLKKREREAIKKRLVTHYGVTVIGKALENATKPNEEEVVLIQWRKKLEQELEDEQRDIDEYYKSIDSEYKKVGRPKSVLNWKEFEYLCSIGCTLDEIAGFFQMSKRALQDKVKAEFDETFSERYEKLSQGMKVSLRRKQFQVAMDGDTKMLTFLGKNVLGQKEKLDFEGEVKVNSWVDLVNNLDPENANDNKEENNE
jgi:AraC-like DNA-binding protein